MKDVNQLVKLNKEEMSQSETAIGYSLQNFCLNISLHLQCLNHVPQATDIHHSKEMSSKSEVVIMPVLMKDEKKYSECVDVLDQLEKWTYDIHSAAGLCPSELPSSDAPAPIIGCHSRPDQPASHIPPTASERDPLSGVKIPCFGDQLTRVRFAGAKDLRAGCHSAKDRLDLYPFCIVYWHTKRSFLKVWLIQITVVQCRLL